MERVTATATASITFPHEPTNYDEISMQQSMLFSESLKDLKNLRKQLYSAAEYFELSFTNDDQKQIVVKTLKDYAIKALVNTVDHLGSVTFKVNHLLDANVDQVFGTEIRMSCIEQRMRTCLDYMGCEGLSQQSLVINTPKYHKRYILPGGEAVNGALQLKSKHQGCSLDDEEAWRQFINSIKATIGETPLSLVGRGPSASPLPKLAQQHGRHSFPNNTLNMDSDKITPSPLQFPLLRSVSFSLTTPKGSRTDTPSRSRPTPSKPLFGRQPCVSEPHKSASMCIHVEEETPKEIDQLPSKSKRLLKGLLRRRKSKKDNVLYSYLDEYQQNHVYRE